LLHLILEVMAAAYSLAMVRPCFRWEVSTTMTEYFNFLGCDTTWFGRYHHHPRCYNACRVLTDSIISLHHLVDMH